MNNLLFILRYINGPYDTHNHAEYVCETIIMYEEEALSVDEISQCIL